MISHDITDHYGRVVVLVHVAMKSTRHCSSHAEVSTKTNYFLIDYTTSYMHVYCCNSTSLYCERKKHREMYSEYQYQIRISKTV